MKKLKTYSYVWDTTNLCKTFNIGGETILSETYECLLTGTHFPGMKGQKHSEETKEKMSKSMSGIKKPSLHKKGKLIKDGVIYEFTCMSEACKELGIGIGNLSELMSGKRHTIKKWKKYD